MLLRSWRTAPDLWPNRRNGGNLLQNKMAEQTMITRFTAGCVVLALMGCAPSVPDSNPNAQGVGFGNYDAYASQRAARDAQLEARISDEDVAATAIAQNTQSVLDQTAPGGSPISRVSTLRPGRKSAVPWKLSLQRRSPRGRSWRGSS